MRTKKTENKITKFNVIHFNINCDKFEEYNIFPYLERCYKEAKQKPETFEEFKQFVENKSRYQWWARCEYEIILLDWPVQETKEKWDIHRQVMMNIDVITKLFIEHVKK